MKKMKNRYMEWLLIQVPFLMLIEILLIGWFNIKLWQIITIAIIFSIATILDEWKYLEYKKKDIQKELLDKIKIKLNKMLNEINSGLEINFIMDDQQCMRMDGNIN